jgi:hypothetical protein
MNNSFFTGDEEYVTLSSPKAPEIDPREREAFDEAMAEVGPPPPGLYEGLTADDLTADDLTADEIHVTLDVLQGLTGAKGWPWDGYDPSDDDPKTTDNGWKALLQSAMSKLESQLNRK